MERAMEKSSGFLNKMRRSPRGGREVRESVTFDQVQTMVQEGCAAEQVRSLLQGQDKGARAALLQERDNGWTLFHLACQVGRLQLAFCLLELGADVNSETPNGSTGLHFLALLGKDECSPAAVYLQLLAEVLKKGADVTHLNQAGESVLHMATSRKNETGVDFFIESGCDLNVQTKHGETALHYAVNQNVPSIARRLLECGAKDRPNSDMLTAADLAAKKELVDLEQVFAGALVTPSTGQQAVPLRRSDRSAVANRLRAASGIASGMQTSLAGVDEMTSPKSPGREEEIIVWRAPENDPFANDSLNLSEEEEPDELDLRVLGSWETYRNEFFGKRHHVYYGASEESGGGGGKALAVVMARPGGDGVHRSLLVGRGDWETFSIAAEQMLLYTGGDELEQIRQVLNTHKRTKTWKWKAVRRSPMLSNGSLILSLEAKLALRPRICVGVVLGLSGQTKEEEMFENRATRPPEFEAFLNGLGEKIDVSEWPHWKGTFPGDEPQVAWYCAWRGFEIVLHVATVMDATKQRQHVGNDTVLIFYKMGPETVEPAFRGKVNAVALIVRPSSSVGNRALSMSAFYRGWIEGFAPVLPTAAVSLGQAAKLKEILFTNALNASQAAVRSGPYKANRLRLYDNAVGELVAAEEATEDPHAGSEEESGTVRAVRQMPRKKILDRPSALPSASPLSQSPMSIQGKVETVQAPQTLTVSSPGRAVERDDGEVLKAGWLMKRKAKQKGRSGWKKRWCVARDEGLFYYESDKSGEEKLGVLGYQTIQSVELANAGGLMQLSVACVSCDYEFGTCLDGMEMRTWALLLAAQAGVDLSNVSGNASTPPPRPSPLQRKESSNALLVSEEQILAAIDVVKRRGLLRKDLFRVQEDESAADALIVAWGRGEAVDLEKESADAVAGAIRKHFKDHASLLNLSELEQLVNAAKAGSEEGQVLLLDSVLQGKPLLQSLFSLLSRVAEKSHVNKMTAANLAAVFAPTFLRAAEDRPPMLLLEYTKSVMSVAQLGIQHFACCKLGDKQVQWAHSKSEDVTEVVSGGGGSESDADSDPPNDDDDNDDTMALEKNEIVVDFDMDQVLSPTPVKRDRVRPIVAPQPAPQSPMVSRGGNASPKRVAPGPPPKSRAPTPPSKRAPGPPPARRYASPRESPREEAAAVLPSPKPRHPTASKRPDVKVSMSVAPLPDLDDLLQDTDEEKEDDHFHDDEVHKAGSRRSLITESGTVVKAPSSGRFRNKDDPGAAVIESGSDDNDEDWPLVSAIEDDF